MRKVWNQRHSTSEHGVTNHCQHTEKCGEDDQRQERNLANKLGSRRFKNATSIEMRSLEKNKSKARAHSSGNCVTARQQLWPLELSEVWQRVGKRLMLCCGWYVWHMWNPRGGGG